MHLNYFALRHYSNALDALLKESTFINAFSFSKEEIIFSFLTPKNSELFLSVHLVNKSCYLQVLDNYNRPKRNFLYQFEDCNGGIVEAVAQIDFDRSFYIKLKTGNKILFKLHGGFSNIIEINNEGAVEDVFKKEFANDATIVLDKLGKSFDLDLLLADEITDYSALQKIIPLLDNKCIDFMQESNFMTMSKIEKKQFLDNYFTSAPVKFYLTKQSSKSYLQIFPKEDAIPFENPLEAYTQLARQVLPSYQFENLKQIISSQLVSQLKKTEKQLFSINKQLENANSFLKYEQLGHIILANMHGIPKKATRVELLDFYTNETIEVKLEKDLSAHENAEKYYRKSKALKHDLPNLNNNFELLTNQILELTKLMEALEGINDFKSLKQFAVTNGLQKESEEKPAFPFRTMVVDEFDVWIGKNATNNDLLTFGYAHKNDTWLHAKDVSGSHVIIKNQSGKIITKSTIEKVAAIAAYYSKSKSQGLAAVQYTIKKFVVKAKGRNPGAVHLLSEQTVLVKPGI